MRQCNFCKKEYRVYDCDAGTHLEQFCSNKCATNAEREIEAANRYIAGQCKFDLSERCLRMNWTTEDCTGCAMLPERKI
jgi:hypothetical protein